jgi:uncharacterized membrane protein (UPF0182 family)
MTSRESSRATKTQLERELARTDLANLLGLLALIAIGVGYLAMFGVLGDSSFAVKFETGEFAPGYDATGGQVAAVIVACAGLASVVAVFAAACIKATKVVAVVAVVLLLAAVPYLPLAFVTVGLAF